MLEVVLDEGVIEVDVVGYKYFIVQETVDVLCYFGECWCAFYHLVGYSCELLDEAGDVAVGIDEGLPGVQDCSAIMNNDGYLGDAVSCGIASGGFNIYNGVQHFLEPQISLID